MNSIGGHTVDLTLRRGNCGESCISTLTNVLGRLATRDELANLFDVTAVRLRRNIEVDLLAHNLAAYDFSNVDADIDEAKLLWQCAEPFRIEPDMDHRPESHVPRYSAER